MARGGGGALSPQARVKTLSFPAVKTVALSSERADPHLHLRITHFVGRRLALLPPGLVGLPDG